MSAQDSNLYITGFLNPPAFLLAVPTPPFFSYLSSATEVDAPHLHHPLAFLLHLFFPRVTQTACCSLILHS